METASLAGGGAERHLAATSRTLGFLERGRDLAPGAVSVRVPEALAGAEVSVCGVKGFLIDERRAFRTEDGGEVEVDCAKVAALEILDSPVHQHGETVETYHVLSGTGRMLVGERVEPVGPGSFLLIPPGVPHGMVSDDPRTPVRVVMSFTPGLAPVQHERFRDERIVAPRASARIAELTPPAP